MARGWLAITLTAAAATLSAACSDGPGTGVAAPSPQPAVASSPPAIVTPAPPPIASPSTPAAEPFTLAVGGDVHFEGVVRPRLSNPATALGPIAAVLSSADLAVVNLETAITERGTAEAKTYRFRAPASAFTALRAAGVDVVSMANNHGRDFGPVGLEDSLSAAAAAQFPVIGIGRDETAAFAPHRATVKGNRVAVVAATHVLDGNLASAWTAGAGKPGLASAYEEEDLVAAVRAARASSDTVVAFLHWGQERAACPTGRQQAMARLLVDAGADVIVGSHAHVLLGGGMLGSAYVHYGLGNFVWYSSNSEAATRTGVLTLTLLGRQVQGAKWTPAQIRGGVPVPLEGAAGEQARAQWERQRGCTGLAALG